ncbi:MAG TPA: hypothetical protein VFW65_36880 [Pseudonocardiaceae bacterium]|nr:hypothetical protein [Pseudonocardiaceae bacterium]
MATPRHSLLGLGTPGGDHCADGADLAAGVHLLWTFDPALGFPIGGYDIARREHRPPEWLCLPFDQAGLPAHGETTWEWGPFTITVTPGPVALNDSACGRTPGLALAGTRTLTVDCSLPGVAVRATGVGAPPTVEAAAGPDTVLARRSADDGWSVELWAPDITEIRIIGDDLVVCTLCLGVAVPEGGWRPLTEHPILLPVVPPGTNNLPGLIQGRAATLALARSRLPATLPEATADRLAAGFADAPRELVELMLRGDAVPTSATTAAGARSAPRLGLDAGAVLALAALDPDLSRMLGLTWYDPMRIGRGDYRVTAHYGSVRYPADSIRFDDTTPGVIPPGTVTVGGLTVVGSAGLAGLSTHALRVEPPLPGTRAGLILPPGVRSVRMRLAATGDGDGVLFTGRRGNRAVTTAIGESGRPVVIEDAGVLDSVTWDTGPLDLIEVELSDTPGTVGDLAAYAWNLTATEHVPVRSLAIVDVATDAATRPPTPDGRLLPCAGVVGLDWDLAGDVHDVGQPVRVLVAVSPADATHGPFIVVNADRPAPAASRTGDSVGTWPGPDVPQRWIQPVEQPGQYGVRVGGIDAFGRLGPWTAARTVQVGAAPEPGVPDAVSARYLDPDDPALTDADRTLCDGTPGIVVEWTWPAGRRLQAPEVDEFDVYLRRGDPNLVSGTVIDVDRHADHSRLDTDVDWSGPAGALIGQLLRLGGDSYPVLDHGSGASTWFDVGHLSTPLRRPGTGTCTIAVARGAPTYVGFDRPADFDRRVTVVTADPAPPVTTTVVTVRPLTLADPVTIDGAGLLLSRGVGYPVTEQLHLGAVRQPDGGRVLPAVGDACTVWSDTSYQAWLPGIRLEPGPADAFAVATLGVAARHGPTAAARVAVPRHGRPPVLPVTRPDGDVPSVLAEPADWYGQAHYTVPLDPVPGVVGYRVLRASTAALFAFDQSLSGAGPEFYQSLTNRQIMEMSDLDTHQEVFQPAHVGTVPGPAFRDTMDGRGAGRFLYRVRTVDAAGTGGPLSPTFPIVDLRDVTPPKPPTVLSAVGDEHSVVLTWRAGTEPDLAGYRVWRSARAADLADVRRRPVHAEIAAVAGPLSSTWTDPGLEPTGEWYYRLAAVDATGNVSAPSGVVRARPIDTEPPEPPEWRSAERLPGTGIALAWLVDEDGVTCMVERRRDRDRIYGARTGWLTPVDGTRGFAWQDDDPGPGAVTYRIRVRDVMGNEQRYRWNPVTVPGEDT